MTKLIVANWKMNGSRESLKAFLAALSTTNNTVLCPPFTLLESAANQGITLGAQDCSLYEKGAYTGEISASMLKELGCQYVIVGHSERRQYHQENNELVCQKAEAALKAGLTPIICIGESLAEREEGETLTVLKNQMDECLPKGNIVVAYEPIWAIGTGLTADTAQIAEAHSYIFRHSGKQALYGGSVKASNAKAILEIPYVGGLLVGGASLDATEFNQIIANM